MSAHCRSEAAPPNQQQLRRFETKEAFFKLPLPFFRAAYWQGCIRPSPPLTMVPGSHAIAPRAL
jgi:hypothetical protein